MNAATFLLLYSPTDVASSQRPKVMVMVGRAYKTTIVVRFMASFGIKKERRCAPPL